MKKFLSFIVVTIFTTTSQELKSQTPSNESRNEEISIVKINPSDEIRGLVITDLNAKKEKFSEIPVTLYPNPSSGLLNISFNSNSQSNVSVEIVDMLGKKTVEEHFYAKIGSNVHTLFISRLKNGLYYINVKKESGISTQRFTKN